MFPWPSLHERMCQTWGSNSGPLACQTDTLPIKLPRPAFEVKSTQWSVFLSILINVHSTVWQSANVTFPKMQFRNFFIHPLWWRYSSTFSTIATKIKFTILWQVLLCEADWPSKFCERSNRCGLWLGTRLCRSDDHTSMQITGSHGSTWKKYKNAQFMNLYCFSAH